METEEIIIAGAYKSLKADRRYEVNGAASSDIAAILVEISDYIEPYSYEFSGIDTKKIDSMIPAAQGLRAACDFLKTLKRDSLLSAAREKKTMVPIAESYLLNQLFKKAGVAFKPAAATSIKPVKEAPEDQIVFLGSCKGWIAVKKLSIDGKTEDWEVSAILAGINYTLVNKSFDFAGMKKEIGGEGRKSFGALVAALEKVDEKDAYAVCKTCENFGYKPYAAPQMLMKEYPDVKPPKIKGRKAKG
jgi:hypothetical protein